MSKAGSGLYQSLQALAALLVVQFTGNTTHCRAYSTFRMDTISGLILTPWTLEQTLITSTSL